MKSNLVTIEKVAFRYGLYTAAGFIAYLFLTVHIKPGVLTSMEILNVLILVCGILGAMHYYQKHAAHQLIYMKGLGLGMLTTVISMVIYTAFVLLYLTLINPAYLGQSVHYAAVDNPNALELALVLFIEGLAFGVLISYALMQYIRIGRLNKDFDE